VGLFKNIGLIPATIEEMQEALKVAVKDVNERDNPDAPRLHDGALSQLRGLTTVLSFLFGTSGDNYAAYKMVLRKDKPSAANTNASVQQSWVTKLCLWCMSPALAFCDMSNKALSVVLTSGTLSPLSSFAFELVKQHTIHRSYR
jgi:Fanconi anemia group J protein